MTDWYYSDNQQQQHGPIGADELTALHNKGLLPGDTLVWREGLSSWKPWREMIHEVITGGRAGDPLTDAAAKAAQQAALDDGAYRPYAAVAPSPYTPPQARVADTARRSSGSGYVVYAGFWKRVAASFIDSFILGIGGGIIGGILGAGMAVSGNLSTLQAESVGNLVGILLNLFYFAGMQSSHFQASLGKMAVGIKVTTTDGEQLKFLHALVRQVAMILNVVTLGIGLLITAFTTRKQALHDLLCGTLVVDKYAFTEEEGQQNESLGIVTIIVLGFFGLLIVGAFLFGLLAATALRSALQ